MTRQEIMNDPTIHYLTKDILKMTEDRDIVDAYYDVKLVLDVLNEEKHEAVVSNE